MDGQNISSLGFEELIGREWLATNHLGGYACSTLTGQNTRKYHGLLIAAIAPPVRRMVILSRVQETLLCGDQHFELSSNEYPGTIFPQGHKLLRAFSNEPYPRWAYQGTGWTIEKSLRLLPGENTVVLSYTALGGGGHNCGTLELRPLFALRGIHELMQQWNAKLDAEAKSPNLLRIPASARSPEVYFAHDGEFFGKVYWYLNTFYRREEQRGYSGLEDLWMPGVVRWKLRPGQTVNFICSTEPIDLEKTLQKAYKFESDALVPHSNDAHQDALMRAAEQYVAEIPSPESSTPTTAIVTQYPWSPPSGREALISLPGLLLATGKFAQAKNLLQSFAAKLKDGLLPTTFLEDASQPEYRGADVSLWFINAVHEYFCYTADEQFLTSGILDTIDSVLQTYLHGTGLGISADAGGLLVSREIGWGTSWMDAKIGGWLVTQRAGRPVELNALWYNAIQIAATLFNRFGRQTRAHELTSLAQSVKASFNRRFWNETARCCFDCVEDDANDASIRPNQLLAVSLPYPVLSEDRFTSVVEKVRSELLTTYGLRTLSPRDKNYYGHYAGNVVERDRALHQGSVYPWLLGPFVTAYLRAYGRTDQIRTKVRSFIEPCMGYLQHQGVGQLCELFDGDPPHHPGGAIASARSVAELLRCYVEDILDRHPTANSSIIVDINTLITNT